MLFGIRDKKVEENLVRSMEQLIKGNAEFKEV